MEHARTDIIVVMYRKNSIVDFDGRRRGIIAGCTCEYVLNTGWWRLECNECVWIVPGTVDESYECTGGHPSLEHACLLEDF